VFPSVMARSRFSTVTCPEHPATSVASSSALLIDARFESMVAPENSCGLVLHANDARGSPQLT
jgi:hypothetical protein